MFNFLKMGGLFLLYLQLTACSYSPNMLKETYNSLSTEVAEDIKSPLNVNPKQSAIIDDYAEQLLQWHRQNKLPEYARTFAQLSNLVKQEDIPLSSLQVAFNQLDGLPHFQQATHLTYKLIPLAKSFSNTQITQLEQSLYKDYRDYQSEISTPLDKEVTDGFSVFFKFMGIRLGSKQIALIKQSVNKFHDIRPYRLQAEKVWNKQLISALRQPNAANFTARISHLWNVQDSPLKGNAGQREKENKALLVQLMKDLLMSFSEPQKEKLSQTLLSISHTLNELASE